MMTIDKSRCVECGACITACSLGIFRRDEEGKVFAREKECMDCFHCAAACPAKAVVTHGMTEESTYPAAPESQLLHSIQSRRSIRHFSDQLPDKAVIGRALDGAAYAPSGKNEHKNRWTVVYGREKVEELYQLVLEWAESVEHYKHLVWLARKGIDPVTCGAPCLVLGHNDPTRSIPRMIPSLPPPWRNSCWWSPVWAPAGAAISAGRPREVRPSGKSWACPRGIRYTPSSWWACPGSTIPTFLTVPRRKSTGWNKLHRLV